MTEENAIQQIEQILADLKSGDETALDRLTALLGDTTSGDKITVGDISGSTAVAIGSDIRITVRQQALPDAVVTRLIALADALDKQAEATFEAKGHIRVFLSSPGDVADERKLALKAIARLQNNPLYKEKITIEAVAWDKPDDSTPLLASVDPQTAINEGAARPSECDIVAVILWSRMGTPLDSNRYQKEDGSQYLSGTEWEFEEALAASQKTGRPFVIVYRRTEKVLLDPDSPDFQEKVEQRRRVQDFFAGFVNPDGSSRQGYNSYTTPSEFEDIFELHLRKLVARLIDEGQPRMEHKRGVNPDKIVRPVEWPIDVSPFPGLRAFGPEDAPVYFGRGEETDQLVKRLADPDCRCLAVVGASGSGKSSLVAAGLLPRLAEGAIEGSKDWPVVRFTPDEWGEGDPFNSLVGALVSEPLSMPQRGLARSLRGSPEALFSALEEQLASWPEWAKVLLFIDQFEELFTRVDDADLRRDFAVALTHAAGTARIKIVLTMRADFFHRVAELPALAALLKAHENRTFPMSAPGPMELYEMIIGPARVAGLQFDDGLARQILEDTGDDPGALALMAYALQQLYEESHGHGKLTWATYNRFGGVQGAIGEQARATFEKLSSEAQAALPVVFRELVNVGFDEQGNLKATRKRAALSSVTADEACAELVNALTDARLLVTSVGEYPIVEVAHEALFRSWPKLKAWIDEAQDDLILLRQVRAAADEWANKRHPDYLRWPAERLEPVFAMYERLQPSLTEMEQDFTEPEQERLLRKIDDIQTSHQRRRWIGERLATIGDVRTGIGLDEHGLPQIDWLPVPGSQGEIEFQDKDGKSYGSFDVKPFYVARYLITHRQFDTFLKAPGGFSDSRWWRDFQQDYVKQEMSVAMQQYDNYPRDNVSWYQCVAFARWLDFKYREFGLFDTFTFPLQGEGVTASLRRGLETEGWQLRLPTEWEWQWMAQGGAEARQYPWGEWDEYPRTNTSEAGIGNRSTAVGMYPHGAATCGALDVSGNLWEWCLNDYDNPQVTDGYGNGAGKVLRGGSFYYDRPRATCTYRNNYNPNNRYYNYGLRVVIAWL